MDEDGQNGEVDMTPMEVQCAQGALWGPTDDVEYLKEQERLMNVLGWCEGDLERAKDRVEEISAQMARLEVCRRAAVDNLQRSEKAVAAARDKCQLSGPPLAAESDTESDENEEKQAVAIRTDNTLPGLFRYPGWLI